MPSIFNRGRRCFTNKWFKWFIISMLHNVCTMNCNDISLLMMQPSSATFRTNELTHGIHKMPIWNYGQSDERSIMFADTQNYCSSIKRQCPFCVISWRCDSANILYNEKSNRKPYFGSLLHRILLGYDCWDALHKSISLLLFFSLGLWTATQSKWYLSELEHNNKGSKRKLRPFRSI